MTNKCYICKCAFLPNIILQPIKKFIHVKYLYNCSMCKQFFTTKPILTIYTGKTRTDVVNTIVLLLLTPSTKECILMKDLLNVMCVVTLVIPKLVLQHILEKIHTNVLYVIIRHTKKHTTYNCIKNDNLIKLKNDNT
jgi:hypothetical protein